MTQERTTYEVRGATVFHVGDNQAVWECRDAESAQACADRLNAGDQSVALYGPMFCEQHRQTLWPHDDCAGPGVWLPTVELNERGIYPKKVEA